MLVQIYVAIIMIIGIQFIVFHEEFNHLYMPFQYWEMIEDWNTFVLILFDLHNMHKLEQFMFSMYGVRRILILSALLPFLGFLTRTLDLTLKGVAKTVQFEPAQVRGSLWALSLVLHIDTADITEIDICRPILVLILWFPSHRYIVMSCFSGFAQKFCRKILLTHFGLLEW